MDGSREKKKEERSKERRINERKEEKIGTKMFTPAMEIFQIVRTTNKAMTKNTERTTCTDQ